MYDPPRGVDALGCSMQGLRLAGKNSLKSTSMVSRDRRGWPRGRSPEEIRVKRFEMKPRSIDWRGAHCVHFWQSLKIMRCITIEQRMKDYIT